MAEIGTLRKFGLSEKEAKMYIALLEFGSIKAGELMNRLSIYSKTAYELLNKLMEKGLASYTLKANIKYYQAVDPDKFLDLIKEKENELRVTEEELRKMLPSLKKKRELSKEPQEANMFIGRKGMKSVFENILKEKKEILTFGGGGYFKRTLESYYDIWHKKRVKEKIKLKLLLNEKFIDQKEELLKIPLLEVRFLSKEFDNPAPAMIYGDEVAITVWSETPIVTLIRSKEVANSYKSYFNLLWKMAK